MWPTNPKYHVSSSPTNQPINLKSKQKNPFKINLTGSKLKSDRQACVIMIFVAACDPDKSTRAGSVYWRNKWESCDQNHILFTGSWQQQGTAAVNHYRQTCCVKRLLFSMTDRSIAGHPVCNHPCKTKGGSDDDGR